MNRPKVTDEKVRVEWANRILSHLHNHKPPKALQLNPNIISDWLAHFQVMDFPLDNFRFFATLSLYGYRWINTKVYSELIHLNLEQILLESLLICTQEWAKTVKDNVSVIRVGDHIRVGKVGEYQLKVYDIDCSTLSGLAASGDGENNLHFNWEDAIVLREQVE